MRQRGVALDGGALPLRLREPPPRVGVVRVHRHRRPARWRTGVRPGRQVRQRLPRAAPSGRRPDLPDLRDLRAAHHPEPLDGLDLPGHRHGRALHRGARRTQLGELARPAAGRADLDLPGRAEVRLRVERLTRVDKVVERWISPRTQRELTLARWGHYGTPLLVFPTAGGDAEEIERHHLLGHLAEAVDAGRVKVYSVDSTAGRALSTHEGSPEHRMWLFNQYHDAIASEVVPAIQADTGGHEIVAAGSSIGAFNALAMVCRYPQLFRAAICMSGTFHMEKFLGGFNDDLYFSSPVHFVKGMEGPQLDLLRQRFVVLASGSGRWEDTGESWAVGNVLGEKGIPNRVDDWGPEYDHDWPTWWKMLPTYVDEIVG